MEKIFEICLIYFTSAMIETLSQMIIVIWFLAQCLRFYALPFPLCPGQDLSDISDQLFFFQSVLSPSCLTLYHRNWTFFHLNVTVPIVQRLICLIPDWTTHLLSCLFQFKLSVDTHLVADRPKRPTSRTCSLLLPPVGGHSPGRR